MVLEGEEGEMSLTPVGDRPLPGSIPFSSHKDLEAIRLQDEQDEHDDDLTPFLLSTHTTRINGLNLLNVAAYLMHLIVSYGVGVWGLDGLVDTRVEIAQEYETLVTPSPWAYYIWIPILMTETVFVTAQLFPEFRSTPIIQQGTSFFFFYTCLLQTGWTLFFAFKLFIFSFVCVVLVVISLASLLTSQHWAQIRGRKSFEEFWLFRFPFCLHFAWMVVMACNDFAILIRYEFKHDIDTQLASDIVAMGILLPVACFFMLRTEGPNFIIPGVILWSYVGMLTRLLDPSDKLMKDYGDMVVNAVRQSLYFFVGTVSLVLGPRVLIWICNEYFTIRVLDLNREEDGATSSRYSYFNGNR